MKNSRQRSRAKIRSIVLGACVFAVGTFWLLSLSSARHVTRCSSAATVFKLQSRVKEKELQHDSDGKDPISYDDDYVYRYMFSALPLGCDFGSSGNNDNDYNPHSVLRNILSLAELKSNSTGDRIHEIYGQLTMQALKESNVSIDQWIHRCSLLIPISFAQRALLQERSLTAQNDEENPLFQLIVQKIEMKQGNNNCILSSDRENPLDLFLQLIACGLSRSGVPVLRPSNQHVADQVKELVLVFGLVFYVTSYSDDVESRVLCGSSNRTRNSVVPIPSVGEEPICISVDEVAMDQGIVDSNFDTIVKHFFLNRYAVSVLRNEPLALETTVATTEQPGNSSDIKTLGVMVSGDGRIANGGDLFGPEVANHLLLTTKRRQPTYSERVSVVIGSANTTPPVIAIVGSILQWGIKQPNLIHWGTGIIMDMKVSKLDPSSTILAVRGPRTRDLLLAQQGLNPAVIGDPALLAGDFFTPDSIPSQQKKDICFVVHGVDRKDVTARCPFCMERLVNNYDRNPVRILQQLSYCQRVVSSSLHGVIFSHALAIPALPVAVGDRITGGDFKFKDYMHSVGVTSFQSRFNISQVWESRNLTVMDWVRLVDEAVQPRFPIQTHHFYQTFPTLH